MKKVLSLFFFILLAKFCFAQGNPYLGFGNTVQRQINLPDTNLRIGGAPGGYIQVTTKSQLDKKSSTILPIGFKGQILKSSTDNSRFYIPVEPLIYGQFIYTDAQKARAFAAGSATQRQIFNNFFRYSHGGSATNPQLGESNNRIPGQPYQTNSWAYDTTLNRVNSTLNTGSVIGLVSRDKYDSYVHTVTLGSTAADNDFIGVDIAFMEDSLDMVTNYAYGLDPSGFNWPINTTSPLVPNQHSLSVFRNRNGPITSYFVVYDYQKLTSQIISDGSSLPGIYSTTANWPGVTVDVSIQRSKDTILVKTTNFSDAPGGKGLFAFPININLSSNPLLYKFRGKQPYGYSALSQSNAFYSNIYFSGSNNIVYDLRNGDTFSFLSSGYVLDTSKNMYRDFGARFFWRNKTELTYGYILPGNTFDVLIGPQP